MPNISAHAPPPYLTIAELSATMKKTVEQKFEFLRVRGEISQPRTPGSGHIYFTLKDDKHTLACVIWRSAAGQMKVKPEEGLDVICAGKMTIFSGQSRYQLIVTNLDIAGEGALLKQLEERKRKLAAEGLFDPSRKQSLPRFPSVIGVITSPTGAVIKDILHRFKERFGVHVLLWGVAVQGAGAAEQIAAAIEGFNRLPARELSSGELPPRESSPREFLPKEFPPGKFPRPDLLIVARGGGSLEDLWAFNEEIVVRAAAASQLPLISAVGHETDTVLLDYAADIRAPTPTAAAEIATPIAADLHARMNEQAARMTRGLSLKLDFSRTHLKGTARGLLHPSELLERHQQQIDFMTMSLTSSLNRRLDEGQWRLDALRERLKNPRQKYTDIEHKLQGLYAQMEGGTRRFFARATERLDKAERLLAAHSYAHVLQRGFVLVTDQNGTPIKKSIEAKKGAAVHLCFADKKRTALLDHEEVKGDKIKRDEGKAGKGRGTKPVSQTDLF